MEELYKMIEQRIKDSGYAGVINGKEFYEDVSAEADEKENGTYIFIIKKTEELMYKGCMTISDEQFDLHYVDILVGDTSCHVDFD